MVTSTRVKNKLPSILCDGNTSERENKNALCGIVSG